MQRGLGPQLRQLIDLLDGAVADAYRKEGLRYRPRYTPILRALMIKQPITVTQIAETAGITQPAATQTIAVMIREGLLSAEPGTEDSRQKMVRITPQGRRLLPRLQTCWEATTSAANSLDADLPFPLSELLDLAIDALAENPFEARIESARREATKGRSTAEPGKRRRKP